VQDADQVKVAARRLTSSLHAETCSIQAHPLQTPGRSSAPFLLDGTSAGLLLPRLCSEELNIVMTEKSSDTNSRDAVTATRRGARRRLRPRFPPIHATI